MSAFAFLRLRRRAALLALGLGALLLAGCASAPVTTSMQVAAPPAARSTAPGTVSVTVSGGQETSAIDGPNISDADFRSAVERTLVDARAFQGMAGDGTGRYALQARIVRLTKPLFGGTFTVDLEVAWTLLDRQGDRVLLRKPLTASGTATMSDAFVGATRIRLAVEAAARANIALLLRELDGVSY